MDFLKRIWQGLLGVLAVLAVAIAFIAFAAAFQSGDRLQAATGFGFVAVALWFMHGGKKAESRAFDVTGHIRQTQEQRTTPVEAHRESRLNELLALTEVVTLLQLEDMAVIEALYAERQAVIETAKDAGEEPDTSDLDSAAIATRILAHLRQKAFCPTPPADGAEPEAIKSYQASLVNYRKNLARTILGIADHRICANLASKEKPWVFFRERVMTPEAAAALQAAEVVEGREIEAASAGAAEGDGGETAIQGDHPSPSPGAQEAPPPAP